MLSARSTAPSIQIRPCTRCITESPLEPGPSLVGCPGTVCIAGARRYKRPTPVDLYPDGRHIRECRRSTLGARDDHHAVHVRVNITVIEVDPAGVEGDAVVASRIEDRRLEGAGVGIDGVRGSATVVPGHRVALAGEDGDGMNAKSTIVTSPICSFPPPGFPP